MWRWALRVASGSGGSTGTGSASVRESASTRRSCGLSTISGVARTGAGRVPLRIAPDTRFDGGLDLFAPTRLRSRDLPWIARYALGRGDMTRSRDLVYAHDADRLEIVCDRPLPLQADGEDLGDVEHAVFEAERDAVTVLV